MAAPVVTFYGNTNTEASPTWTEVTSGKRVAFTGAGGATGMTDAQIPNVTKPTGPPPTIAPEAWVETGTNTWLEVDVTYDGTVNTNNNVFRWGLATNAPASAPIFTAYDAGGRTVVSKILAGDATDTSSTSYIKAARTSALGSSWTTATTGSAGAVTAVDTGQSLQGDTQYLQDTVSTTGNRQFNIVPYVGANLTAGTYTDRLSCKYTYT